ncbi:MAG: zinc ABC transporter permease subunit ZnuB [Pseudomonadales bacterium]|nr:zinc ABC transporter permease subunit ZnuB [Pseudomonadales bacterium]NRA15735.1 zinc ABC transporter permease subunit ZnuB [Oceanospirillaceae bacterium]
MFYDFLIYALVGGIGVALVAGPLGAFVVWRRMSYFGDSLAHSALLGVAIGIFFEINLNIAIIICCLLLAILLVAMQKQHFIATDTLLGIMAHSSLSLGLVTISFIEDARIDLMAFLFGDLLAILPEDLLWILLGGVLVLSLLYYYWPQMIAMTINEELAAVEGVPVAKMRLLLMLMIALVIAVAMKIVGVLLITSLLIIPAASARPLSRSPEKMALLASLLGCAAVVMGLLASFEFDTPAGPSVVVAAMVIFMSIYLWPRKVAH